MKKYLKFGTGGLRGIMGPATNQMNKNTIWRATQGLANYILSQNRQEDGVVIGHDTRLHSREFACEAAGCLAANGIKVYLFDRSTPTPESSYAIRQKKAVAGIVITASHNAKEYNGYKVYWEDGGQITPPHDKNIMAEVEKVNALWEACLDDTDLALEVASDKNVVVKTMAVEELENSPLYHVLGEDMEETYVNEIMVLVSNLMSGDYKEGISQRDIKKEITVGISKKETMDCKPGKKELKIAYTPLHGTGLYPVTKVLKKAGFTNVCLEPAQSIQDGNFPTVSYPNPESKKAWDLGLAFAKEVEAEVVFATDPDADRVGMYCKDKKSGEYIWFTGNMAGVLVGEYLLSHGLWRKEQKKTTMVRTIVSSKMLDGIAESYDVDMLETLTGFKYIGEQIRFFEEKKDRTFVYGFEESCGCLFGDYVRDKDGVAAVLMLCEIAQDLKNQGLTLWDYMLSLYEKYGYFLESQKTIAFEGEDGAKNMSRIMEEIRRKPLKTLGDFKVFAFRDYKTGKSINLATGEESLLTLPKSNVMYFELENKCWCCVRPSGTEPKLKMYFGVKGESLENAKELQKALESGFEEMLLYNI